MAMEAVNSLWMVLAILLALLMAPGLGLFYGGFAREKHAVNAIFLSFVVAPPLLFLWFLIGYSLVFSGDYFGLIGDLHFFALRNIPEKTAGVPSSLFILFQGIFSALACAIISGAVIERIKRGFWIAFSLLWTLFVYYPVAHWVWGKGGWIGGLGGFDFAGGLVVHISSGTSALCLAKLIGRRLDFFKLKKSYNLGLVYVGATFLWIGWFGFNAGSALGVNSSAITAVAATLSASCSVLFSWYVFDLIFSPHKPSFKGLNIALICGLVAITPCAGYVGLWESFFIGAAAGALCNLGNRYFHSVIKIDDASDVFISHGASGFLGALLLGVFASSQINPEISNGLWHGGDWSILRANLLGSLAVMAYSAIVTKLIYGLLSKALRPRMDKREENAGADLSEHGERVIVINSENET